MRRHEHKHVARGGVDERSSIGDFYVNQAIEELNRTCLKSVATMVQYEGTREGTLPMLFRDSDLEKLKQVRGLVTPQSNIGQYPIGIGATLYINFDEALVPTIVQERLYIQPDRIAPLLNYVAAVRAVHDRFEEVKAVLRWLNRNATPGAIRYYWPSAMKLCPTSPIWRDLQDVPSRYSHPPLISSWSQTLKDAAATVAGAQMLPSSAQANKKGTMWLTLATTIVHPTVDSSYSTDQMIYNL